MIRRDFLGSVIGLFAATGLPFIADVPITVPDEATQQNIMKSLSDENSDHYCLIKLTDDSIIKGPAVVKTWKDDWIHFTFDKINITQQVSFKELMIFDRKYGHIWSAPIMHQYVMLPGDTANISFKLQTFANQIART